ncbi:hypothetical protein N7E81_02935 [Reichenbachiella carrageenanivorans]|uniref:FAD:protein FMN transferase n=1 Tax=Reichenbachiella carrageenanivorans TaxID=2979869 RepID=A0ABY6D875_9BACT|nr:hypothetical protein [Reichenbachiella carrageenanivorans]UXX80060.1 hypothetical protein N7E81_02935 [Reichenbachiella carrageenanivorans]
MKRLLYLLAIVIITISCEQSQLLKSDAEVMQVKGIYIYVYATPKMEFDYLGNVKNNLGEQLNIATEGKKKFGDLLEGVISTGAQNADFRKVLDNMIKLTKQQYRDADGIVFPENLSQGWAIKFRDN